MVSLRERWLLWRNGMIASAAFQRWAAAFPLTRRTANRHATRLFDRVTGFVYTQVIRACVDLDALALLAKSPLSAADFAHRCSLPAQSAETLLKAAASIDLVEALGDGRYILGQAGAALNANPGLAAMIRHHETLYRDLADPVALLRDPGNGALAGYWPYGEPDAQAAGRYSALMTATQPMIADQVLAAYDFGRHRKLLDIGGGEGAFLSLVGAKHSDLQLVLFDLPDVSTRVTNPQIEAFGGSFKSDALPTGADCISLVRILHDHDDDVVKALLVRIRDALPSGGTLLIAEPMADTKGAEAMGHGYFGFYLLAMGSGRPRSAAEYHALLKEVGFASSRDVRTNLPLICQTIAATR